MIGQYIHNYQITDRLGEGGMGVVYKATDTVLGREVALKMLHGQLIKQTQFLDRFKKEARVLAQLLHPNIAVIYNFIAQDENHFMVMEYVQGKNLDELLRQNRVLLYDTVCPVFMQALEGLHHAHKKGIYHRDIKPSNLILTPDGTVKLMDFGIAKIAGEQRLTQVNRVVGTIEFMAPELIEGKDPSVASDIYATGVTMYELLTGKLPFEGNTDFNLMQDILKKKPLSVEKLNAAVPNALSAIVMKALEKKPESRFADAKTFQQALIQAFPSLKEVDLSKIITTHKAAPATQVIEQYGQTNQPLKPTALYEKATNPSNTVLAPIPDIKTKILSKKNRPYLVGIVSLLFLTIAGFSLFSGRKQDDSANEIKKKPDSTQIAINKEKEPINNNQYTPPPNNVTPPSTTELVETPDTNEEKKMEKTVEKKAGKKVDRVKEIDKEKITEKVIPPVIPEKKEEPPVIEKNERVVPPTSKKKNTLLIEDRLRVNLSPRQNISSSGAQQGQSLSFIVSGNVLYSGHVIVESGTTVQGQLKNVSDNKWSIDINGVRAVDGQLLYFSNNELIIRGNELQSKRSYTAYLKNGIKVSY